MHFRAVFEAAVATAPEALAVCDGGDRYTWRDWQARAHALARGLQDLGVAGGDVVAVQLPNGMDFLALHVAVAMVGGVLLPVHTDCVPRETESLLRRASPVVLILADASKHGDGQTLGRAMQEAIPDLRRVLTAGGGPAHEPDSLEHLAASWEGACPLPVDVTPDMPFVLVPSSGTTSRRPKICMHSHRSLLTNALSVIADGGGPGPSDVVLSASPFSFLFGMLSIHLSVLCATRQVILRGWDTGRLVAAAESAPPTFLYAVPTQLRDILAEITAPDGLRLPRLSEIRTGGAPVPEELATSLTRLLTDRVVVQWGMSEIGAGTYTRPADKPEQAARTIGRPADGARVRVVDEDGRPCEPGLVGELQFRSASMFHGYLGEPELTRQAMTADGWLRTGDLACLTPDGSVAFRGRSAGLINVGGRKVNATEIEELLQDFTAVHDAVLVGCDDERLGETPVLLCTVRDDRRPTLQEVADHLALKGVAPYKLPTSLHVVERLPRTPTGKVARRRATDLGRSLTAERRARQRLSSPDSSPGELRAAVLAMVCDAAAEILGSAVDAAGTFKDMGFDSLMGSRLRSVLAHRTGLDLPVGLLFDHPTPLRVAHFLAGQESDPAASGLPRTPREPAPPGEPIAIVGVGCRLPGGVSSPDEFWEVLRTGREVRSELPEDRGWPLERVYSPEPAKAGTTVSRHGGFLSGIGEFDARFFSVEEREAASLDPQQRVLLETVWEALERAGIPAGALRGSDASVFVGMMPSDYAPRWFESPESYDGTLGLGVAGSVASGRISYILGTHGTALTVDTACSSSLVAVHLACEELRRGTTGLAIVGGVTVMSTPANMVEFSRQGLLAPDGRCKAFAEGADGVGLAEGAGALVLERLSDAQRNGHKVLGIVRGSAVTQDGASNGLTAPNPYAQEQAIGRALRAAGLAAGDVDVVEAHGTGTSLGDAVELQALRNTYGAGRSQDRPLWLGSVKSNLGHTQAAAGLVSLIKMLLSLEHEVIPATLHAAEPRRAEDWSSGAIRLAAGAVPWPAEERTRRAAVSSFGISGTNAHLILQEPPRTPRGTAPKPVPAGAPWLLSAPDPDLLPVMAGRLDSVLTDLNGAGSDDVGPALALGRTLFTHRAAVLPDRHGDHRPALRALAGATASVDIVTGAAAPGPTVFVFPGHGSHWTGMAAALMAESEVFARAVAEWDEEFGALLPWSVAGVLRAEPDAPALESPQVVQPVTFTVMVSLAELWRSYGVRPDVVVGHSQGEIAAAHVAGGLTRADAARIVALRGRLMDRIAGRGAMASLRLGPDEAERWIARWADDVCVAVVNSPRSVVISGTAAAVAEAVARAEQEGIRVRRLAGDVAFHSPQADALLDELQGGLADLTPMPGAVPFVSATTGGRVPTERLDGAHWRRNMRDRVDFRAAVEDLIGRGHRRFVEISPHHVLGTAVAETAAAVDTPVGCTGSLHEDDPGLSRFLRSLAEAHAHGAEVDWRKVFAVPSVDASALPTYPYRRRTFWHAPVPSGAEPAAPAEAVTAESVGAATAEPLRSVLLRLPPEECRARLVELICTSVASVLEAPAAALVVAEAEFEALGLSSLAAVEARNLIAQALGASLPATVVFDYDGPLSLADYLLDYLQVNHTAEAPPEPAAAVEPHAGTPAEEHRALPTGFEAVYRGLTAKGEPEAAWDMVLSAARLRTTFHAKDDLGGLNLAAFRHATGRQDPTLVCIPSVVALAGRAEYKKFAAPFNGMRDVVQLSEPGFSDGEELPQDLDALVAAYTEAIHRHTGDGPIALCGRSFGGWIAHRVGARLVELGRPPVGVVLIDTFWPGEEFVTKFVPRTLRRLVDRQRELGTELGVSRLTAIGWYLRMLREWCPEPSGLPTLYLIPEDETSIEQHLRSGGWQLPHTEVRVPADHFSVMDADAGETAAVVEEWLSGLGVGNEDA
ncbi:acyltransferase domain-containing protein [Streptomyces sp. NPDC048277]|uniref:type I polyketide synthase n=1 Tax=Streptomyces sp. NPDC048277 TaxID=3155027 RepID=UPI0033D5648C